VQRLKVEVLIPKFYNDKKPIEPIKHVRTYQNIIKKFRGCTEDTTSLMGSWLNEKGVKYEDENFSYWVICDENKDTRRFLDRFKKRLKRRYRQEDVMMYCIPIYVI
jgi:hypothetical protein